MSELLTVVNILLSIPWRLVAVIGAFYAAVAVLTFGLWIAYRRVMKLKEWRDRKKRSRKELVIAWLKWGWLVVGGLVADVLHRYLVAPFILLGLGRLDDYTVTAWLQYIREEMPGNGWRQRYQRRAADYICERLLNPYDSGHCAWLLVPLLAFAIAMPVPADINTPTDMRPFLFNVEVSTARKPEIWFFYTDHYNKRQCRKVEPWRVASTTLMDYTERVRMFQFIPDVQWLMFGDGGDQKLTTEEQAFCDAYWEQIPLP